jgi:hypothetical protein
MQVEITIAANGNLVLTLPQEHREEWAYRMQAVGSDVALHEAVEGYWTNGSFEPFDAGDANPFVGLTSAPCIAEAMSVNDDGTREIVGRFWYFQNYMVTDFGAILRDTGTVEFQRGPD